MKDLNTTKTQLLASKDAQALLARLRNERYFKEFEEVVREYDRELEQKDEEILNLRARALPEEELQAVLGKFTAAIALLEGQLERERSEKARLTQKFMEMDEAVRLMADRHRKQDD